MLIKACAISKLIFLNFLNRMKSIKHLNENLSKEKIHIEVKFL
jgi:hypothetical protein